VSDEWKCRLGWHSWEKWKVVEVACKKLVEVNYVDEWVDSFRRSQNRTCRVCGLYQEASA
jgi:hypothetical protein